MTKINHEREIEPLKGVNTLGLSGRDRSLPKATKKQIKFLKALGWDGDELDEEMLDKYEASDLIDTFKRRRSRRRKS